MVFFVRQIKDEEDFGSFARSNAHAHLSLVLYCLPFPGRPRHYDIAAQHRAMTDHLLKLESDKERALGMCICTKSTSARTLLSGRHQVQMTTVIALCRPMAWLTRNGNLIVEGTSAGSSSCDVFMHCCLFPLSLTAS